MKKDSSKPQAHDSAKPELAKVTEPEVTQAMQPMQAERAELPEAIGEGGADEGHRILAQEYRESAKLLGQSETTEMGLVALAKRQGISADAAISDYVNNQLPRQDFYNQPVLLGDTA
jgi:hypothetical protein